MLATTSHKISNDQEWNMWFGKIRNLVFVCTNECMCYVALSPEFSSTCHVCSLGHTVSTPLSQTGSMWLCTRLYKSNDTEWLEISSTTVDIHTYSVNTHTHQPNPRIKDWFCVVALVQHEILRPWQLNDILTLIDTRVLGLGTTLNAKTFSPMNTPMNLHWC